MHKSKTEKCKEQTVVGDIGEAFFDEHIFPKQKCFNGMRNVKVKGKLLDKHLGVDNLILPNDWEVVDVDNNEFMYRVLDESWKHTIDNHKDWKIYFIEIKTDNKAFESRNIPYDVTSHDKAGSLARSKADFVYYIILHEDKVAEYYIVNLYKLRRYIGEHNKEINDYNKSGIKTIYYQDCENEKDGNSLLFLINIDVLERNGVAKIIRNV